MPAIINVCGNFCLGATMALVSRRSQAMRQEFIAWPLLFLLGFESLFVTPLCTYLFRFYPQWSLLYWFDPQIFVNLDRWIGWLSALAIVLNFVAAGVGYTVTRAGILTKLKWLELAPLGAAALVMVFFLYRFGERVAYIGDYDTFWQGNAEMLLARPPGWVGTFLYLGGFAFVGWVRHRYRDRDPSVF